MSKSKIEKIRSGLLKYQYLRQRLFGVDVSADLEYQRTFNGFFRMGRRKQEYYTDFYTYLEQHKVQGVSFAGALQYLYKRHSRMEMSFVSKMVAIVDPSFPIWDRVVTGGHFGIKAPAACVKDRLAKAIEKYDYYCRLYAQFMQTEDAKAKIAFFNEWFPNVDISDVKKVDFILWQER